MTDEAQRNAERWPGHLRIVSDGTLGGTQAMLDDNPVLNCLGGYWKIGYQGNGDRADVGTACLYFDIVPFEGEATDWRPSMPTAREYLRLRLRDWKRARSLRKAKAPAAS